MDDIVTRLRQEAQEWTEVHRGGSGWIYAEAADEIERLQGLIDAYAAAVTAKEAHRCETPTTTTQPRRQGDKEMSRVELVRDLPDSPTGAKQKLVVDTETGQHYVASGVVALITGWEVLVFKCDANGGITDWLEVAGGRGISHAQAIGDLEDRLRGGGGGFLWEIFDHDDDDDEGD